MQPVLVFHFFFHFCKKQSNAYNNTNNNSLVASRSFLYFLTLFKFHFSKDFNRYGEVYSDSEKGVN